MPNPSQIFIDTDALIQLLIADLLAPLRELKRKYGIQPAIVQEVDLEFRSNPKYGTRFLIRYERAIDSGTIIVFGSDALQSHFAHLPAGVVRPDVSWAEIQSLGEQYYLRADLGEAYTHATAVLLRQPALSNDMRALKALMNGNCALPSPVLRPFDMLALFYQNKSLSDGQCDNVRKVLLRENEPLPNDFKPCDFVTGLSTYCPRLLDASLPRIGASAAPREPHEVQMSITPV